MQPTIVLHGAASNLASNMANVQSLVSPATQTGDLVLLLASFIKSGGGGSADPVIVAGGALPQAGPSVFLSGSDYSINAGLFYWTAPESYVYVSANNIGPVFRTVSGSNYTYAEVLAASYGGAGGVAAQAVANSGTGVPLASPTTTTTVPGELAVCLLASADTAGTMTVTASPYPRVYPASAMFSAGCDSGHLYGQQNDFTAYTIGAGNWNWSSAGFDGVAYTVGLWPLREGGWS
jgi:hypothetical protein